jgi:hypothetical protein
MVGSTRLADAETANYLSCQPTRLPHQQPGVFVSEAGNHFLLKRKQ